VILLCVASEKLRLCDDIVAVVGNLLIFLLNVVCLWCLIIFISLVVRAALSILLSWYRLVLISFLPLRPGKIMVGLCASVCLYLVIAAGSGSNRAELVMLLGSLVCLRGIMKWLPVWLSSTLRGTRTIHLVA
jgi:hypothetical protein